MVEHWTNVVKTSSSNDTLNFLLKKVFLYGYVITLGIRIRSRYMEAPCVNVRQQECRFNFCVSDIGIQNRKVLDNKLHPFLIKFYSLILNGPKSGMWFSTDRNLECDRTTRLPRSFSGIVLRDPFQGSCLSKTSVRIPTNNIF